MFRSMYYFLADLVWFRAEGMVKGCSSTKFAEQKTCFGKDCKKHPL